MRLRVLAFLLIFPFASAGIAQEQTAQPPVPDVPDATDGMPNEGLSRETVDDLLERIRLSGDQDALGELERRARTEDSWGKIGLANALLLQDPAANEIERALALLEDAATENSFALVRLGELYFDGGIIPADPPRAVSYFERAVSQGSDAGRGRLGEALLYGRGIERDPQAGLQLLRQAAEDGNEWRLLALANALLLEDGPDPDPQEARQLLERAVQLENPYAQLRLGELLAEGRGGPADPERAFALYHAASTAGIVAGRLRLGEAYIEGLGVEPDAQRGLDLIREAADAEDPEALLALGEIFAAEKVVPGDGGAAVDAFTRAADAGNSYALVRLAELHRDGQLVEPDPQRAIDFLTRAAEQGQEWAYLEIAALLRDGRGQGSGDARAAIAAYESAMAADVSEAAPALARDLLRGHLGRGQRDEGWAILEAALSRGDKGALTVKSDALMWGWGVRQDQRRAKKILEDAAGQGDIEAVRALVSIHRDGRYPSFRRSLPRARDLLATIEDELPPAERALEHFLIEAADTRDTQRFADLLEQFHAIPRPQRRIAFTAVRWVNENLYVFLLQDALGYRGYLEAEPDGRLRAATIAALAAACRDLGEQRQCRQGPLTENAVRVSASFLRGQ